MLKLSKRFSNLNMKRSFDNKIFSLTDYHFKFIVIFNLLIFGFYTLFRFWMAVKLVVIKHQNFFVGIFRVNEEGFPYYTLYRVLFPIFLMAGFLWLFNKFHKRGEIRKVIRTFWFSLLPSWNGIKKYFLFLLASFLILSFIPGFTLLVRNINNVYGMIDTNSYMSIIALMKRGDFNALYVPEGGLQFGKYYINTIPALIVTWIFGIKSLAASYNFSLFLLVFLTIINFVFIFRNLVYTKDENLKDELMKIIFILSFIIILISFVVLRDNFNFNAILQVYCTGFIGATGAIFLLSSIFFLFSYFLREREIKKVNLLFIFLIQFIFCCLLAQDYFNLILFSLPMSGILLALLLSKKSSLMSSFKYLILFIAFLFVNYISYKALDIFPRYSMDPMNKLRIISSGLVAVFLISWFINFRTKDFLYNLFIRFSNWVILFCFSVPFFWYVWRILNLIDMEKVEFLGIPLRLGDARTFIFGILLLAIIIAFLIFNLIKIFLKENFRKIYPIFLAFFCLSLILVRIFIPKNYFPLVYPSYYEDDQKILDTKNLYAFDENGIRLTYNKYLVDVSKYFLKNNILDLYFWLVTKTPSQGIHEIGYLERILATDTHQMQGMTITDLEQFAKDIEVFELITRDREKRFQNRYLIIDNNLDKKTLGYINSSPLYQKKYENALYHIYYLQPLRLNFP